MLDIAATTLAAVLVFALPADDGPVSFKNDVAPILARKCAACHSSNKPKGGLDMTTFALLKKGGKGSGTAILKPGDPDESGLIEAVRPDAEPRMPYKLPPISDPEINILERWVRQGAKFDGPSESETPIASLVDPLRGLPKVAVRIPAVDPVTSLAFSPDGSRLAVAQGPNALLFEAGTGKLEASFPGDAGPLASLHFTPDGSRLLATGGRPGQFGAIVVWDVATRKAVYSKRAHTDQILDSALAADGSLLATAGYDRLVKLWKVADGSEVRTLKEHTDAVHGVSFSPDGKTVASAGADRTVKVWDVATGRKRVTLSDATAELYSVCFLPDGKTVLAAGVDRTIRAWTIQGDSAVLARSAIAHEGPILRLLVSPDGKRLISAGEDKNVRVWDAASLSPVVALPTQPDWPLTVAAGREGSPIAVGRYDGTIAFYNAKSGALESSLLGTSPTPVAAPAKPELVRNASLAPPSPRGGVRGTKMRVALSGNGVGRADVVMFAEKDIEAVIVPAAKPEANRLDVDLTIAPAARVGIHTFRVRTPLGVPAAQPFAVSAEPESKESEPNDDYASASSCAIPKTLVGTMDKPGDVDLFRFSGKAGQSIVFEVTARDLGSKIDPILEVLNESGAVVSQAEATEGGRDPALIFTVESDGTYALRIRDAQFGGSGEHFYRVAASVAPWIKTVFPLGIGRGMTATIGVSGSNLGGISTVPVVVPADLPAGSLLPIQKSSPDGRTSSNSRLVVVAEGPQTVEAEPNDEPARAGRLAAPGGVSGRIDRPGDVDLFRFEAKRGQRRILEVFGRRLGSPIDPVLEILDADGRPVPRALLRPVAETNVAFRDHPSTSRSIRLTHWEDFAVGDYLLVGREVMRLFELPRNPDDDAVMWGLGSARTNPGERIAFLETTPEHHPLAQPIYKIEIHPPGTSFPSGGAAPVVVNTRNDDGGPGIGKDSRVTFDPPADGTYLAVVEDMRGLGGADFGYHLVVRDPRPDFQLSLSTDHPNVPRGGATVVTANVQRIDGFDGAVDVTLEGLPPGLHATSTTIEPGLFAADIAILADEDAPPFSSPAWRAIGRAGAAGSPGEEIVHTIDPGGPLGGWITVTPPPNLKIGFRPDTVEIHPGERVELTLSVERSPAFQGRVPIDVRNLPRGVQVLNIGLNGVLVTEKQTERNVFLYAEPWVTPQERPFFAVGNCEAAGTTHSSKPIRLLVRPAAPGASPAAGSTRP